MIGQNKLFEDNNAGLEVVTDIIYYYSMHFKNQTLYPFIIFLRKMPNLFRFQPLNRKDLQANALETVDFYKKV